MEEFEGRVAVITGGASGLGLAMAQRFADAGMNIVIGDI
ncbi:MAG: SDR family NAD(P)-dependent oxidoreductase, partial [Anaerolineaceae bacterium]